MKIVNIDKKRIVQYVSMQLSSFFPLDEELNKTLLSTYVDMALERLAYCFSSINKKYYQNDNVAEFNVLNSDHYAMFLYFLSNTVYRQEGELTLAERLFLLNKSLHGLDAFYSISLPDIFYFVHPLGTVLGHANYSDYFVVYQGCTIGSTVAGKYPAFSKGVVMYEKSTVIGDCTVGENVIIGSNSSIIDCKIDHNSVVVGNYPTHRVLKNKYNVISGMFG
jgi:serine O-acetyltransferase